MAWGFGSTHTDRTIEVFSRQFEADGDGFLYRRSQRGAPIRVTSEERERFVAGYRRSFRRMTWSIAAAMIVGIAAVTAPAIINDREVNHIWLYPAVVAAMLWVFPVNQHIWNAPARALTGRQAEGRERDASEVRRIRLAQLSWGQLFTAMAVIPFALLHLSGEFDIWHGWGTLWPIGASLTLLLILIQAIRKWQLQAAD